MSEYPEEVASLLRLTTQGLFSCEPPQTLAFGRDWEGVVAKIQHERYLTIFELTQQCNLRCRYCVFGGGFEDRRTHSPLHMSLDVMRMTVASALAHGDALDEIALGFYGGEPLLAFDLLTAAVREVREHQGDKRVALNVTTNGTCLDTNKARFLREAGFNVLLSVDGPRHMHDRYRVFADGRGSYKATMRGLKVLLDVFDSVADERISLNMVVPSTSWLPYLEDFWDAEPWVPRTLRVHASIVDAPPALPPVAAPIGERQTLKSEWLSTVRHGTSQRTPLGSSLFDFRMAKLHQRGIFASPRKTFFPNGCCIPGNRKVFVTADGAYRICERAYGVPAIGSVRRGLDLEQIRAIVEQYSEASCVDCLRCWAVGLCPLCFADAYEGGRFNLARKRAACEDVRKELEADLALYGSIVEDHPEKADEWDRYDLS
ncbi:MAG TPA: radical SAM protein [Vicinamibacterales bacterium]|nr:radical SAM protein [Vicinamibacterales bacterium]